MCGLPGLRQGTPVYPQAALLVMVHGAEQAGDSRLAQEAVRTGPARGVVPRPAS